mmetsp:Transcript_24605/g.97176  ORF Transcript_24605/g.97176 Transcript_24605/m.97176 type:complete len:115 (+) Transcript_24605:381-725(+)
MEQRMLKVCFRKDSFGWTLNLRLRISKLLLFQVSEIAWSHKVFLYSDGDRVVLMDPETYDQVILCFPPYPRPFIRCKSQSRDMKLTFTLGGSSSFESAPRRISCCRYEDRRCSL